MAVAKDDDEVTVPLGHVPADHHESRQDEAKLSVIKKNTNCTEASQF